MGFPWHVLHSATLRILRNGLSGRWRGQTMHNKATAFNSVASGSRDRGFFVLGCKNYKMHRPSSGCRTDHGQLPTASYIAGHMQLRV